MSRKLHRRAARSRGSRFRGFTLAEVLAASAVLALAVAAIAQAVSAGQTTTYRALDELRAQLLAEAMIEEILAKPYADPDGASTPGPESGESNRSKFDNADDYSGYTEDPGDIEDAQGDAYPDIYQTFGRSVAATYTTQTVAGFSADIAGLNITVTITGPRGETWSFSRFRPELEDAGVTP